MEIRIYYEDTDCGGVVYYANYLKYFERARTEFMRSKGIDLAELMESGYLFTVSRVEVDYKSPAYYGDLLHVSTELCDVTKASFSFSHRIERAKDKKLIAQGTAKLVCVNQKGRPVGLPESIAHSFAN
jgi:acyl-CoA thioester hydrolase